MLILTCSYDDVAGLYYLRARRYDTTVGRFTQEDTYIGDGRNLYVYVQNNPLKYVDPSGYNKENHYGSSSERLNDLYYGMSQDALANYDPVKEQEEKKAQERAQKGATQIAKGITITGIGVVTVIYMPTSAPTGFQMILGGLGLTTSTMGLSDIVEGGQNVYYGSNGDSRTSAGNLFKDYILRVDDESYEAVEAFMVFSTGTYGIFSTSFTEPMSGGNISQYANLDLTLLPEELSVPVDSSQLYFNMNLQFFANKNDIRMVNSAAKEIGVDRNLFGEYIHEIKDALGMKANENFTYQELLDLARELKELIK